MTVRVEMANAAASNVANAAASNVANAAASNAGGCEDGASLGSIVTEAVAEERRVRQEEIQKGVIQLLNGKVEEAVLTTSETEVLTYFRLDCHRSWRMFQVHSWSVSLNCMQPCFAQLCCTGSQKMPLPGFVIALTPPRTSHGAS